MKKTILTIFLIIIICVISYGNSLHVPFQFDDTPNIISNKAIYDISNIKKIWDYNPSRFLVFYTFAINYAIGGDNTTYYHIVNLLIHIIASILVFWITIQLFSNKSKLGNFKDVFPFKKNTEKTLKQVQGDQGSVVGDRPGHPELVPLLKFINNEAVSARGWISGSNSNKSVTLTKYKFQIAVFTALIFASHPIATQAVTYIVQRCTSMAVMFYLLSFALYLKTKTTYLGKKPFLIYAFGSITAFAASLFCKEISFTLPIIILIADYIFFEEPKILNRSLFIIPYFLVSTVTGIYFIGKLGSGFSLTEAPEISRFDYIITQINVVFEYIKLLLFPIGQNIDHFYPLITSFQENHTPLKLLILFLIICFGIYYLKREKTVSFGIFWFFITLLITSSIFPIRDPMFEHHLYIALFGFSLFVSSLYFYIAPKTLKPKFLIILPVIIIILLTSLTISRNNIWKESFTLWSDSVKEAPHNIRAYYNLGEIYMQNKDYNLAILQYNIARNIEPQNPSSYNYRGIIYSLKGDYPKAVKDFKTALLLDPIYTDAWDNLGIIYMKQENYKEAVKCFKKAVLLEPGRTNINKDILECNKKIINEKGKLEF